MSPKTAVITLIIIILSGGLFVYYLSVMNQGTGSEMIDFSKFKSLEQDSKEIVEEEPSQIEIEKEVEEAKAEQERILQEAEEIREKAKDRPYTEEEAEKIMNIKYDFRK